MKEYDYKGKVVLLKPHPNGGGRMLPKGQVVVFDVKIAEKLIEKGIAIKWFPTYENSMLEMKKQPIEKPIIKRKPTKKIKNNSITKKEK